MKWIKPSGIEIETNDMEATVKYCESLGWEGVKEKPVKEAKPSASASGAVTRKRSE